MVDIISGHLSLITRVATAEGKQGIWLSNTGDLRNLRKHKENTENLDSTGKKWIIFRFQFRFKIEVESFVLVTRVLEHILSAKNIGKNCKRRKITDSTQGITFEPERGHPDNVFVLLLKEKR